MADYPLSLRLFLNHIRFPITAAWASQNQLPDSCHMMTGVGARFLVARRVTHNGHVTRRRTHDFAHATSPIADDDDRSGRRFTVGVAILQKWHIRFGHTGGHCCAYAHPKGQVGRWWGKEDVQFDQVGGGFWLTHSAIHRKSMQWRSLYINWLLHISNNDLHIIHLM